MALDQSALLELIEVLNTGDGAQLMRRMLAAMLQELIDAEVSAFIGTAPHERSPERTNRRNGTRDKVVTTGVGDVDVKIPKTRTGSFFPSLLAPRRRVDVALHAVIMQAYIEGVSTRRVDDLVVAMGGTGVSKSEVSRICAQLDEQVQAWRDRSLAESPFPYVFLDATYCKARVGRRIVSQVSSSPSASALTAAGKCSASTSATARTGRSGPRSCARCAPAA